METLLHCWWECRLAQPLWRFLKKLNQSYHVTLQSHSWAYTWTQLYFQKICGGPVAKTLISQCWGPGFDSWLGT